MRYTTSRTGGSTFARDLDIRYLVINKELIGNTVGGAEYLREIEKILIPEIDKLTDYLQKVYENDSYVVYTFTDLPKAPRIPLLIDTDWNTFIEILSSRLDLTRIYDLRHLVVSDDLADPANLTVLTDDLHAASLDLYVKAHPEQFAGPNSSIFAFNPDIVPSSYYLSPMFRLFQFFSDSKWNRLNMITPGLFGTSRAVSSVCRVPPSFASTPSFRKMAHTVSCCVAPPPPTNWG